MKYIKGFFFIILLTSEIRLITSKDAEETDLPNVNSTMCLDNKKCVMKCCPFGKFLNIKIVPTKVGGRLRRKRVRFCDYYNETRDMTSIQSVLTDKDGIDVTMFDVRSGIFEVNKKFMFESVDAAALTDFNVYLTENAEVFLEMPNAYNRWTRFPNDKFCWDLKIVNNTNLHTINLQAGLWVYFETSTDKPSESNFISLNAAMLVSCFFLLVVLVVYALLPELRNLCGLILMAYVASLLFAFLLLAIMRMKQLSTDVCFNLSLVIYYLFLASFCWMNVMSYDIWWTFRGYAKARPIHRRGENFKFLMYCLYAWGLPLAMTIMLTVIDKADMTSTPWFITPKITKSGCFIENGEKLLYLYIPMLILIVCNWLFYIMTAYNVWRLSRGTAVLDSAAAGTPQAHRTHWNRFLVYLKLTIVMGLNWVLEVVSYLYPNFKYVWWLTDLYNILIGVSIFLIFVCKPSILKKLMKLFLRCKKSKWHIRQETSTRSTSSTSDNSSASQETQTLQVCSNPKGPAYAMKGI